MSVVTESGVESRHAGRVAALLNGLSLAATSERNKGPAIASKGTSVFVISLARVAPRLSLSALTDQGTATG